MAKVALVTGITGQDGAYLAELLLDKGDATKAEEKLGWKPEYSLDQLISEMVEADRKKLEEELQ